MFGKVIDVVGNSEVVVSSVEVAENINFESVVENVGIVVLDEVADIVCIEVVVVDEGADLTGLVVAVVLLSTIKTVGVEEVEDAVYCLIGE